MTIMVKDPDSRIDFEFDWSIAYPDGLAVVGSLWTIVPDEDGGLTLAGAAHDLTQSTATLAGGIAGHVYRVANRVTLSDGQIDERSVTIRVEER
ncbi:hypothetical protein SAMN05428974_2194 [Sphingopyxis sp. YR583]|jgi:hypothetical protein|uniref:phage fiber-tail adaptor protein n=1 Tax=Sphingopyxis sp. YR583 TaxID=1881047 RepID=UPI0008A7E448|nr:hypothetical protein [Sphingopyxis sp. YR583]SEH17397.1 hypothetical protein SAMN05428974_2194 [Sphingopyxis sp. YR583]